MKFVIGVFLCLAMAMGEGGLKDVYFGTDKDGDGIYHATFDPKEGRLSPAARVAEIEWPGFLALHPNGKVLYTGGILDDVPCIAAYEIVEQGKLKFINSVPVGDGPAVHLTVHPSGKFLFTAQYRGGSIALFLLKEDGAVASRVQLIEHKGGSGVHPRQTVPHPHWSGFSPDGRFALVPDLGLDEILIYKVDVETPKITAHGSAKSVPGGGPRHMIFSKDGRFIYLLNEIALSVTIFQYDSSLGKATPLKTIPSLTEKEKAGSLDNSASEILVHPTGKFVYTGNRGHDTVSVYEANHETGELLRVQVEPVRGATPRNINFDPRGEWLLAAGASSNTISVFSIDQETGRLVFQPGSTINVPCPICILFR